MMQQTTNWKIPKIHKKKMAWQPSCCPHYKKGLWPNDGRGQKKRFCGHTLPAAGKTVREYKRTF